MTDFTMSMFRGKDDMIVAMREHIEMLESQLESIGAGGVERLRSGGAAREYPPLPEPQYQMGGKGHSDDAMRAYVDADRAQSAQALPTPKAETAVEPVAIPDGWRLVPTRLTQAMADAAKTVDGRLSVWKYDDAYQAMLANAPEAPAPVPNALDVETVKKSQRYDWLKDQHWVEPEARFRLALSDRSEYEPSAYDRELTCAIDAAIAAQSAQKNGG